MKKIMVLISALVLTLTLFITMSVDTYANDDVISNVYLYDYYANIEDIDLSFEQDYAYHLSGYVSSNNVTDVYIEKHYGNNPYVLYIDYDNTGYSQNISEKFDVNIYNYLTNGWTFEIKTYVSDIMNRLLDIIRDDIMEIETNEFQIQLGHINDFIYDLFEYEILIQSNMIYYSDFGLRFSSLLENDYRISLNGVVLVDNQLYEGFQPIQFRGTSLYIDSNYLADNQQTYFQYNTFRTLYFLQENSKKVDSFTFVINNSFPYYLLINEYHNFSINVNVKGLENAYLEGLYKGRAEGVQSDDMAQSGFKQLLNTILSYPINMIKSSLDFSIFGVNISQIVMFAISGAIVLFVIKRFTK